MSTVPGKATNQCQDTSKDRFHEPKQSASLGQFVCRKTKTIHSLHFEIHVQPVLVSNGKWPLRDWLIGFGWPHRDY